MGTVVQIFRQEAAAHDQLRSRSEIAPSVGDLLTCGQAVCLAVAELGKTLETIVRSSMCLTMRTFNLTSND
jgi:hypothetical protein